MTPILSSLMVSYVKELAGSCVVDNEVNEFDDNHDHVGVEHSRL